MIRLRTFLLAIGFAITFPLHLEAQLTEGLTQFSVGLPLEVRVIGHTKTVEKTNSNWSNGTGELKKFENSYVAELRYTPLQGSIDGIKLRLISFFAPYKGKEKRKDHTPGNVQIRDNISLQAGESKRIEFDPENFKKSESVSQTLYTISGSRPGENPGTGVNVQTSYGGQEFVGVVLEVYHNDILVGQRFDGLQEIRRVYEDWLAKDSPKTAQPAKKNSGPVLDKGTAQAPPGFFPTQNQDSSIPAGNGAKPKKKSGPVLNKGTAEAPPGFF